MNRQQLIEHFLSRPPEIGDTIIFTGEGNGSQNVNSTAHADIVDMNVDHVYFYGKGGSHRTLLRRSWDDVKRYTGHIGHDPFEPRSSYRTRRTLLWSVLGTLGIDMGWGDDKVEFEDEKYGCPIANFDPFVIIDGEKYHYQRGFVWELEHKQAYIDSIYRRGDIGRFAIKSNSLDFCRQYDAALHDVVDGKQRLTTIVEFILNEFPDSFGVYWTDLSREAKREFGNTPVEELDIPDNITGEEVLKTFLRINNTGVPVDPDHLQDIVNVLN